MLIIKGKTIFPSSWAKVLTTQKVYFYLWIIVCTFLSIHLCKIQTKQQKSETMAVFLCKEVFELRLNDVQYKPIIHCGLQECFFFFAFLIQNCSLDLYQTFMCSSI